MQHREHLYDADVNLRRCREQSRKVCEDLTQDAGYIHTVAVKIV